MPYCGPAFPAFILMGQVRPPGGTGNPMNLGMAGRGSNGQGLTELLFVFFPPVAVASRLGTVFSVEGAPENRAGKSLWPLIFSFQLGSYVFSEQHA